MVAIAVIALGLTLWRWFHDPVMVVLLLMMAITWFRSPKVREEKLPSETLDAFPWRFLVMLVPIAFLAVGFALWGSLTFSDESKQFAIVVMLTIAFFVVLPFVIVYGVLYLRDIQTKRRSPPVLDDDRRDD